MMSDEERDGIDQVTGDGGAKKVPGPTLTELKDEVTQIAESINESADVYDIRHCRWDNQSPDGRKRKEFFKGGKPPRPFDGATDARVRDADMIINEQVQLVTMASVLSVLRVKPTGEEDSEAAANLQVVLDYYLENALGFRWMRELMRLANFVFGETPGAAVLGLEWIREEALELRDLRLSELRMMWVTARMIEGGMTPAAQYSDGTEQARLAEALRGSAAEFEAALLDPGYGAEALEQMVVEFFPDVRPSRAKSMVAEVREQAARGVNPDEISVSFPQPYVRRDEPQVTALQCGRDIFLPTDTSNFEDAWGYFTSELLTRAEVESRAAADGWNESAVKQVLGSGVDDADDRAGALGKITFKKRVYKDGRVVAEDDPSCRNRYEIMTAVLRATNDEGIPGVYTVKFSMYAEQALTERELRTEKHGSYPGVGFAREYIDRYFMNSRGVCALQESAQGLSKLYLDTTGDNAQYTGVPPIVSRNRTGAGQMYVSPMEEIRVRRDGDVKWMNAPAFPSAAVRMFDVLERIRDDYWGRANGNLPAGRSQAAERFKAMIWLGQLQDAHRMLAQLVQQYAPEETVQRLLNGRGKLERSRADIQGHFDYSLVFDTDVLNPETLEKKLNMMKNLLLAMDHEKTVDTAPIVKFYMYMLNPEVARSAVRSTEDAEQSEMQSEAQAYQMIRAGIEPPMPTDGSINPPVRLAFYEQMQRQNPQVFADMGEDKQVLLQQRIQYLQHQQQQAENAQTGRTGVAAATQGGMMSGLVRG